MGTTKRYKAGKGKSRGVKAPGGVHKLRDHRRVQKENHDWVEEIEVEWDGGAITWEPREKIEVGSVAKDVRAVVAWASQGRTTPLPEFRRKYFGKLKYTDGGFVAFKTAFDLIGMPWVTDAAVAAYVASGKALHQDYAAGCTWEQLVGFVGSHGHAKLVSKNLRQRNEEKIEGLGLLTRAPGVYIAGFSGAHVGRLVVVHTTVTSATAIGKSEATTSAAAIDESKTSTSATLTVTVIDESGRFPLTQSEWMNESPMVRVHQIG